MRDEQAERVKTAVLALAVSMRDDDPATVLAAAQRALKAAGGDAVAAVCVAAACIDVERPIRRWWDEGLAGVGPRLEQVARDGAGVVHVTAHGNELQPHGTHAAFNRHRVRGSDPCPECWRGERAYQVARSRRRRAALSEAM